MSAEETTLVTDHNEADEVTKTFIASPVSGRKVRLPLSRGNLMLAGMFLVGLATVYMLNLRVSPETASAEQRQAEIQVDTAISLLDAAAAQHRTPETASLADSFYYEAKQRQIPSWRLSGNPFVFKPPKRKTQSKASRSAAGRPDPNPEALPALSEEDQLDRAMTYAHKLVLQSVLMGPNGAMAMISNNLLSKGQKIHGWTVSDIQSRRVVLTWNDRTHVLKMGQ